MEQQDRFTPRHIAIVMDGNRRWAARQGLQGAVDGHRAGIDAAMNLLRGLRDSPVKVLTLFAFSSENHARSSGEVAGLMELFASAIRRELDTLHEHGVRVHIVGERTRISRSLETLIAQAERRTQNNSERDLVVAFSYGGRWDITNAAVQLAQRVERGEMKSADIDEDALADALALSAFPDPDLCIRTGGEQRLSNFLLWQLAYTELYFTPTLWPEFTVEEFNRIIGECSARERRYGTGAPL